MAMGNILENRGRDGPCRTSSAFSPKFSDRWEIFEMAAQEAFTAPVRKVVMGHDETGRTVIASDAQATTHKPGGDDGIVIYDIWETFQAPTPIDALEPDPSDRPVNFRIPEIGTRVRIADMPPAGDRPAFVHRTESVDAIMVLRGEITMLFDDGEEVVLRPGDTLVQRATNHAWVNRTSEPCRMLFIMIGGALTPDLKSLLQVDRLAWDGEHHPIYSASPPSV
jgi:mannose-6-phosphate isomerase-like protein (cupin superfamily)